MGYYVKYKELQSVQSTVLKQINQWVEELEKVRVQTEAVAQMGEIKGEA